VIHFLSLFSIVWKTNWVEFQRYLGGCCHIKSRWQQRPVLWSCLKTNTCLCPKSVSQICLMLLQVLKFVIKLGRPMRCLKMVLGYSHMLKHRYDVLSCSPWYSWKMFHLALNNNHLLLTPKYGWCVNLRWHSYYQYTMSNMPYMGTMI
jgi:hypothetical protein